MRFDYSESGALYLQIAKMLEDGILQGIYLPGEAVPSTNELAREYSINPATAAKGINLLVEQEILYKKRGIGMFVASDAPQRIQTKRQGLFYDSYIVEVVQEGLRLGLSAQQMNQMIEKAAQQLQDKEGKA
ncbi:MAG: GntR family transcriptional regulator [Candidatus Fournierella pullistercoris]|uniref:GntR family transcriptional regulator n=1 Tax=Candidatus Allofournierella pullistercoris TaxID=2838597 RepID=A0A948T0A4_9FIRM|nr:GntR family transcriptional regulator [Candidatus Fournierella pullistercoris]